MFSLNKAFDEKQTFDKVQKEVFPKKKIINFCVDYYGEQYREKITEIIEELDVVFVAEDLLGYGLNVLFKKEFQDNNEEKIDWEKRSSIFKTNLNEFAKDSKDFSPDILAGDAKILHQMGFNIRKIIKVEAEGGISIIDSEETERLKKYINSLNPPSVKKVSGYEIVDLYEKCAKENKLYDLFVLSGEGENLFVSSSQKVKLNFRSDLKFPELPKGFMDFVDSECLDFLEDFVSAKGKLDSWSEEESKYILNGMNKMFNKNFQTMEEFIKDESMELIIRLREEIQKVVERADVFEKNKSFNNDGKNTHVQSSVYNSTISDFLSDLTCAAFYQRNGHMLCCPVNNRISVNSILHEVNHALSIDFKSKRVGFHDEEVGVGFNEIVNEFLTMQLREKIDDRDLRSMQCMEDSGCGYRPAINIMKKFLITFEDVLKESQINSPNKLKEFIGEENFNNLIICGNILKQEFEFGNLKLFSDATAEKWLEYHQKNPDAVYNISPALQSKMIMLLNVNNFLDGMCAKYNEFKSGKQPVVPVTQQKLNTFQQEQGITN